MPWRDKNSGRTFLRYKQGQCLHYYFYFILEDLGLCYLRVPTWAPFRLQFYFNGHHWLAGRLRKAGVEFEMRDNAFVRIADYDKAQRLADGFNVRTLHRRLDQLARRCCPVIADFPGLPVRHDYHWSLMQVEYATDVTFKRQRDLAPLYQEIVRTAIHTVKPENVATFLGRKLQPNYLDELGNDFHTRVEGTRCKRSDHHMGRVSVKMYDKFQLILRVETTANDVSFFCKRSDHHREVEHRDGTRELKFAPMKKGLYSLGPLREVMAACNRRYLEFVAAVEDPSANLKELDRLSRPVRRQGRRSRGFNVFHGDDAELLRTILEGGFCLSGFRNADIRQRFPGKRSSQVSLLLKRLRQHGLIKKATRCYKYYLTRFGRRVGLMALKLKELFIIPSLRGLLATPANS